MPVSEESTGGRELCGKWMPRAKAYCARGAGHGGDCNSPEFMERQRAYTRAKDRPYDPEAARRWKAVSNVTRYGLTPEKFAQMLEEQGYCCAMGGEPFEDGQRVCIDHDHACCPYEKRSCGRCVRGLLCVSCNTALGIIEKRLSQAQAYLTSRARLRAV